MANYLLAYVGGDEPDSEEAGAAVMNAWIAWFGTLGDAVVDPGNPIGASAAVSGFTAAALRFVFQMGGPLGAMRQTGEEAYRMPALGLGAMLRNGPVMGMVVVWIAVNVAFGAISLPIPGFEGQIAWQAHLAGFAAGLLLFRFFDPVARA